MLIVLNKAIVHVVGRYAESDLRVLVTRRARRHDAELDARIDGAWARRTAANPKLFDGVLARLVAHGVLPDRLALFVGRTTFKEFVGTNLEAEAEPAIHESLGEDYFANPLGVSALIETKDGQLLLGRRSDAVAEASGQLDLPGGHVEWREGVGCTPFEQMVRELDEELGLRREELAELTCVGLVENGLTHKPELIFRCKVDDKAKRLEKRIAARGDGEHSELHFVPSGKNELLDLLRGRGSEITPVAAGAIGILVS